MTSPESMKDCFCVKLAQWIFYMTISIKLGEELLNKSLFLFFLPTKSIHTLLLKLNQLRCCLRSENSDLIK